MEAIQVPTEGRPAEAPGSERMIGWDGNAFAIMGSAIKALRRAGASQEFIKAYQTEATSGDYDRLLAVTVAFLDAE